MRILSIIWITTIGVVLSLPALSHVRRRGGGDRAAGFPGVVDPDPGICKLCARAYGSDRFQARGWKLIIVALLVFLGTFIGSAIMSEAALDATQAPMPGRS